MAEVVDVDANEVAGEIPEPQEQQEQQPEVVEQKQEEDDVPVKYRGKEVKDIIKMAMEAESLMRRHSEEVHETRKLADELIKQQLESVRQKAQPAEQVTENEIDLFEDPKRYVQKAIEEHPTVKQAAITVEQFQKAQAQQAFVSKHPDYQQVLANPVAKQLVESSPYWQELWNKADQGYDVAAADMIVSTAKMLIKQATPTPTQPQPVPKEEVAARDSALKSVAVDSGGTGDSGKKIFKRADLIRLRMKEPNRFADMQDEIDAAYREGRVR